MISSGSKRVLVTIRLRSKIGFKLAPFTTAGLSPARSCNSFARRPANELMG
jgi:hypothetical protein